MAILRAVFVVIVCARLVTATSILAATGVDDFLCADECSTGTNAVTGFENSLKNGCLNTNLRLCRISDADVHALRGCLDGIGRDNIDTLDLGGNEFTTLPGDIFEGMTSMTSLHLDMNNLQTLPAEVFEGLDALVELDLRGNPDLQCVYTDSSIPVCESSATGKDVDPAPSGEGHVHLRERETRSLNQGTLVSRRLPEISLGVLGKKYDVQEHVSATDQEETAVEDSENAAITPAWDSTACLSHWGRPELIDTPDPDGYIIFVYGREQLGGNKYLVADGLFLAKALGRTLVEYPVKDSRNVGFEDSRYGFGIYWDAMELCMYNRILDLERFRMMAADGRIPAENFVTVTSAGNDFFLLGDMKTEDDVVEYFKEYSRSQVIVMERMWKSGVEREALQYLRPNPFFVGVVRTLIQEQEDWGLGKFVAVQWRTETSTGNLTECYEEVKIVIEQQRIALGYGVHQVFINTDLIAGTSGTFTDAQKSGGAELLERVQRDYPAALDNRLHSFTSKITDTGTRSIVAGLAVASSEVMLASSLNGKSHRTDQDAFRCQKVYSGYIHLIAQWREKVMGSPAEGVYRLFPLGDFE